MIPGVVASGVNLANAQTVELASLDATAMVNSPTVSQDAQVVAPSALDASAVVNEPAVTPGAVVIGMNVLDAGATVNSPAVVGPLQTVSMNSLDASATVNNPTVTQPSLVGFVAERGVAGDTNTIDLPAAGSITVGNYLILRFAANNNGSGGAATFTGVTDPRGNTWTVIGPFARGTQNAGTQTAIAYAEVNNAYTDGDDLVLTFSANPSARVTVVEEYTDIHGTTPIAVAATTNNGTATPFQVTCPTPTAAGQLLYTSGGYEQTAAVGADSDTVDGAWVPTTTQSTGGGTTGMRCIGSYKIVTGTSAQSIDRSLGSNSDWYGIAVVFDKA